MGVRQSLQSASPLPTLAPVEEFAVKTFSLTNLADQSWIAAWTRWSLSAARIPADLIAYIAEFDRRRLFVPAGYPSMYLYCVQKLHFTEQSAYKRIHVARAALKFPAIFPAWLKAACT
jgi:hypothetical protein